MTNIIANDPLLLSQYSNIVANNPEIGGELGPIYGAY